MDDETIEKDLNKIGALLRSLKPGDECPSDSALFDYVYGGLPEAERARYAEHHEKCVRCRYEVMRMETDRAAWRYSLDKDPDAALARALGPDGVGRARAILARGTGPAVSGPADRFASLWDKYRARVEAGWEKVQAALETALEWAAGAAAPVALKRGLREWEPAQVTFTYSLGDKHPELPASPPEDAHYHTLFSLRPDRNNIVVQYENRKIFLPLHIAPEFSERDIGLNHLFVIYSAEPLDILQGEAKIEPDRFAEIMQQARKENAQSADFMVEVRRKD
jgi:hypothetical protein